jgi:hypothetical protein
LKPSVLADEIAVEPAHRREFGVLVGEAVLHYR